MITLSVKQPWAYLICQGIKNIENRTWKLPEKYKGKRVLIHASLSTQLDGIALYEYLTESQIQCISLNIPDYCKQRWMHGAIIGSVVISDCVINHPSIWAEKTQISAFHDVLDDLKLLGRVIPPHPITYNWVLSDPILFDQPILDVKGKLNFWEYNGKIPEL